MINSKTKKRNIYIVGFNELQNEEVFNFSLAIGTSESYPALGQVFRLLL